MPSTAEPLVLPSRRPKEETRDTHEAGYLVICWDDPVNLMDYVTHVFQKVFGWPRKKAEEHMLQVHNNGKGVAGVYTHDVARTKVVQVEQIARKHEHPLACQIEACEG